MCIWIPWNIQYLNKVILLFLSVVDLPWHILWLQDIGEHLTTIHLKRCSRGKRCLYEGSTPPEGFPNSWVIFSSNHCLITLLVFFYQYQCLNICTFLKTEWSNLLYFRACCYEEQWDTHLGSGLWRRWKSS